MPGDKWTAREAELLQRLAERAEADPLFTEDEVDLIKQVLEAFRGWRAFGRGLRAFVVTMGMIAAAITAWGVISERVRAWILGN